MQQLLRACGLTTLTRPAEEYGLGLTIGNAEARLLELANAYACLASGDNWLAGRAVLAAAAASAPRLAFPPPGTILYLDPDLPGQGRRLALRADGAERLRWQSDSLQIVEEQGRAIALLTEGRHQISVDDPRTGAQARTWIEVVAR